MGDSGPIVLNHNLPKPMETPGTASGHYNFDQQEYSSALNIGNWLFHPSEKLISCYDNGRE
jgi:hypothetical protein